MTKHRKVWESSFGTIPKDDEGRTYEIHHIDGNHKNNNPDNLKLVSIQEHYDIHYAQGDYSACVLIGLRMKKSPEEIAELSRKNARKLVEEGTHHFLKGGPREDMIGDKNPMKNPITAKKVSDKVRGKPKTRTDKRIQADLNRVGIKLNYTDEGLKRQQENGRKRFTLNNPSSIKLTCIHCNTTCDTGNHARWHGDNCRMNK